MIFHVMSVFYTKKNVITLYHRWYVKNLVSIVDEYENVELIGNARSNSLFVTYHSSGVGPALRGKKCPSRRILRCLMKKLVIIMWCRVLTNIFGRRIVLAYVRSHTARRKYCHIGMRHLRNIG